MFTYLVSYVRLTCKMKIIETPKKNNCSKMERKSNVNILDKRNAPT